MARRKNTSHDQRTREKIQTSQLINRLLSDANGEIELTTGQRKSIEILLKKALPDLQAIEMNANVSGELSPEAMKWLGRTS